MKNKKIPQPPPLTPHDIRELRTNIHHLKPVIIIGSNGLTNAVIQETDRALNDHELIKIRIHIEDREELNKITNAICTQTGATLIQVIGHIVAIYRKNLQPDEVK
jgi:RNA-binding protein